MSTKVSSGVNHRVPKDLRGVLTAKKNGDVLDW
jgi:hypothetical protein